MYSVCYIFKKKDLDNSEIAQITLMKLMVTQLLVTALIAIPMQRLISVSILKHSEFTGSYELRVKCSQ